MHLQSDTSAPRLARARGSEPLPAAAMGARMAKMEEPAPAAAPASAAGAADAAPPAAAAAAAAAGAGAGAGAAAPPRAADWLNLPCPVKYEDLQRETQASMRPDHFEGFRFDMTKPVSPKFMLSHSLSMVNDEHLTQGNQIVKTPSSQYELGANVIDSRLLLIGRVDSQGALSARGKYDFTDRLSAKFQAQLVGEPDMSQTMFDFDYRGGDFQTQLKVGNNSFYGWNYIQSVTPRTALGGEIFWLGQQRKSGVGLAGRHESPAGHVATCQVATTRLLSMSYWHKVSDKVYLSADFMWNWGQREAQAALGYDYMLNTGRVRGKIDSSGIMSMFLEERFTQGLNLVLSAVVDHSKNNHKFGVGLTVGE